MGRGYEHRFYDGKLAHETAMKRKAESRAGIDCTKERLVEIAGFVRPMLKKGRVPSISGRTAKRGFPLSLRTFCNYVEMGVFDSIVNLEKVQEQIYQLSLKE